MGAFTNPAIDAEQSMDRNGMPTLSGTCFPRHSEERPERRRIHVRGVPSTFATSATIAVVEAAGADAKTYACEPPIIRGVGECMSTSGGSITAMGLKSAAAGA